MLLVIFPPLPIDSVSSGSVFTGSMNLEGADKHALFSYQEQLITGTLKRLKHKEATCFSLILGFVQVLPYSFHFRHQIPLSKPDSSLSSNPPTAATLFSTVRLCFLLVKPEQGIITESWIKHVLSNAFWSQILYFPNGLLKFFWDSYLCFQRESNRNKQE